MRERLTARVLLFDAQGRVLLLKGRLPGRPMHTSSWFTVGGGVEPGESLHAAALREIAEETGFVEGVELGPVVWTRQAVSLLSSGERALFVESYLVARCRGGEPSRAGWEAHENELIDDIRWWALEEIAATSDRIYPERFGELIGAIAAGDYPPAPLEISVAHAAGRAVIAAPRRRRMGGSMIIAVLAAAAAISAACDLEAPSGEAGCTRAAVDALKINDLQAVGTHNSYKQAISPAQMKLLRAADPKQADGLDYAHPPLPAQLNAGARQLELDLLYDPQGGRYAAPLAMKVAGDVPYDLEPLKGPGLKVMHVQDIDYRSSCPLFADCLKAVRAWSQEHPGHLPILILLNLKEGGLELPGAVQAVPFDAAAMDAVDAEIRAVFEPAELITPDDVQGRSASLREAVLAGAWPTLKAARGKVMFALDAPENQVALYRGDRRSLEGRVMFVNIEEASPAAGYITLNEPKKQAARIAAAVKAGLIVRTRADADTAEARTNDHSREQAAFASGAQYVSTDYMKPDPRLGPFEVKLPGGGVARRNPVR